MRNLRKIVPIINPARVRMCSFRHWIFFIILVGSFVYFGGCDAPQKDERFRDYGKLNPEGDFLLTDQDGNTFRLKDHRGKTVLLFFGYISCPDICPTTLSKLARVYALLGDQGAEVLTVFVSVDPERDTPQKLKEYLGYFKVKAVGLTGTKSEIDQVTSAYEVSYEIVNTSSVLGYMVNHTDYLFLIDRDGNVRYLFRPEDNAEKLVSVIRKVL